VKLHTNTHTLFHTHTHTHTPQAAYCEVLHSFCMFLFCLFHIGWIDWWLCCVGWGWMILWRYNKTATGFCHKHTQREGSGHLTIKGS